ncbi:ABC transporter ATP-binding protein [Haloglomus litoreum]|uniref:ABC transporter ATP-binding protein n=1 Tax=Haloglomus litoreum TaxID=3034026 RepID=UPI0023E8B979|nr:ABC transporter ATP-binding protein [Haloglomus sp. DT116]
MVTADGGDSLPFLEMRNIHKTFPGVVANDQIDFAVERGEIHGLLGENGAGKSTLMKILYGLYHPDGGEIRLDGRPVDLESPQDAIELGIGMVHQHFKLIPKLTVAENVVLGLREPAGSAGSDGGPLSKGPLATLWSLFTRDRERTDERVAELAARYGLEVDPAREVWQLDVGQQQRVEILKALYRDVELLVLDEPTAVLTPAQIDRLFETLERLRAEGLTIIIITHKLGELTDITDRVTVLRDGQRVDTVTTDTVSESDLAEMMVGREVLLDVDIERRQPGAPVLRTDALRVENDRGIEAVSGVDLTVHEGEVVGIAGVSGNGQRELVEAVAGIRDATGGSITVGETTLDPGDTRAFVEAGVAYIPEDRHKYGCAPGLDLTRNAIMKTYRSSDYDRIAGVGLDYGAAREYAEHIVEEFDVRVPDVDVQARNLSGGNLQKFIIGRELSRNPRLVLANQPSRGLDVGAIEYVQSVMLEQRQANTGILLLSEDLDEVLELSDRIVVMYDGELIYETTAADADRDTVGAYMTRGAEGERGGETRQRGDV